jgi:xylan 1,4-beta-xylosidase
MSVRPWAVGVVVLGVLSFLVLTSIKSIPSMSSTSSSAAQAAEGLATTAVPAGTVVRVDCAQRAGEIRPLHGVNNGPLCYGETVDLSPYFRELAFPLARLHDSDWPNADLVNIHAIFPDMRADPNVPASYRFGRTDDYVKAIVDAGVGIVYRLGENIEHSPRKHFVHPPADPRKWAAVCVGIIRHYNEGWADGFHHKIRYWEIWNEPENRPAMWTGTPEEYYRLYVTASRTIKARFPDLKVGGPSLGDTGKLDEEGELVPTPFLKGFLAAVKAGAAPLDFFSWHTYTDDPAVLPEKARAVRGLLDAAGLPKAENHLNEWNYLPGNDWGPLCKGGEGTRRRECFRQMLGAPGAAFLAVALIGFQGSPIDVANYYGGDTGQFGLFDRDGTPNKTLYAMRAFKMLLDTPLCLKVAGDNDQPGRLAVCAGTNKDKSAVTVLIANFRAKDKALALHVANLPWQGATKWEILRVDAQRDLTRIHTDSVDAGDVRVPIACESPCVVVVRLRKAE